MRFISACAICLLLAAGCARQAGIVLGKMPESESHNVLAIRDGKTPPLVTLSGVMYEKCPTAGCWFRLRDGSGEIKVDTKSAGFVVVDVPLNSKVTVAGKVVADGNDVQIEATGIRY